MNHTPLSYSQYTPTPESRKSVFKSDAIWKNSKSRLLKAMECDETALKSQYLGTCDFYYCKKHDLIVKIDNYFCQRSVITPHEESNIRKWNSL